MSAFEDYAAALEQFKKADCELDQTAKFITVVGNLLGKKRHKVKLSHVPGSFPASVILDTTMEPFDGRAWPDSITLNQRLSAWHQARENLKRAWQEMPQEQREIVLPPPREALIA